MQVGCKTRWDATLSDKNIPPCNSSDQYRQNIELLKPLILNLTREYGKILDKIRASDLDNIFKLTKCTKPCKYKKYNLLGDMKPSLFKTEYVAFSLWAVSENTRVSTEQLIYPISSLVAEFGGTLSLFLGVSFVTIWDNFHFFGMLCRVGFKK